MTPSPSYPDNRFYVYILLRETDEPFYVGKGTRRRWLDHEKDAKYRDTYKDRIVRKMVAEGNEIRRFKYAEGMTEKEAFHLERELIIAIGRYPNGPLANATDGGEGVSNPSPEVREKIGAANKGNKYGVGRKNTPEQKQAMLDGRRKVGWNRESYEKSAQKLRGRKHTDEHRENISAGNKGKVITKEQRIKIGIAHRRENLSEETLLKMKESQKGKTFSVETRKKMRISRLSFVQKENENPEAVEARRKSASKAGFERWRMKRLNQQEENV